jgi:hypothetical protein
MEINEQRPINDFSGAMEAALRAIRGKDFEQAAILASLAYNLAPDPSEQARAARDLSAAYRHLNKYDEAEEWVAKAIKQHRALAEEVIKQQEGLENLTEKDKKRRRRVLRELGASVATLGTLQLQRIATDPSYDNQENSQQAAENLSKGLRYIEESREYTTNKNSKIDQYDINFTARRSFAEALAGNKKISLTLGARAMWLAFSSESPKIDTSNPKLSITERFKAKARASVRGVGTVAVAGVAPFNRELAKSIVKKLN